MKKMGRENKMRDRKKTHDKFTLYIWLNKREVVSDLRTFKRREFFGLNFLEGCV